MTHLRGSAERLYSHFRRAGFVLSFGVLSSVYAVGPVPSHLKRAGTLASSATSSSALSPKEKEAKAHEQERIYLLGLKIMENFGCSDFTDLGIAALIDYLRGQAEFPTQPRTRVVFTPEEHARNLTGHFRVLNYTEKTDTPESKIRSSRGAYSQAFRELSKIINEDIYRSYGNNADLAKIADDIDNPRSQYGAVFKDKLRAALVKLNKFSDVDHLNVGCRVQGEPKDYKKNKLLVQLNEKDSAGKPVKIHLDEYLKRKEKKKSDVVDSTVVPAALPPAKIQTPVAPAAPTATPKIEDHGAVAPERMATPPAPAKPEAPAKPSAPAKPAPSPALAKPAPPAKKLAAEKPSVNVAEDEEVAHPPKPSKPTKPAPSKPKKQPAPAEPTPPPAEAAKVTTEGVVETVTRSSKINVSRFIDLDYVNYRFRNSPVLKGKGAKIIAAARRYGVDPVFFVSVIAFETGWGTSYKIRVKNNPGGVFRDGRYVTFSSIEEGLDLMARNLRDRYIARGIYSVAAVAAVYAPPGAKNDPEDTNHLWPGSVVSTMNTFIKGSVAQRKNK